MNRIEALELELDAEIMVEGTSIGWGDVIRYADDKKPVFTHSLNDLDNDWEIAPRDAYELALGIIEGKPVWKGDTLYRTAQHIKSHSGYVTIGHSHDLSLPGWSWLPLKN